MPIAINIQSHSFFIIDLAYTFCSETAELTTSKKSSHDYSPFSSAAGASPISAATGVAAAAAKASGFSRISLILSATSKNPYSAP